MSLVYSFYIRSKQTENLQTILIKLVSFLDKKNLGFIEKTQSLLKNLCQALANF